MTPASVRVRWCRHHGYLYQAPGEDGPQCDHICRDRGSGEAQVSPVSPVTNHSPAWAPADQWGPGVCPGVSSVQCGGGNFSAGWEAGADTTNHYTSPAAPGWSGDQSHAGKWAERGVKITPDPANSYKMSHVMSVAENGL